MKSLKKENKGFSLVELIVVIAILGILAVTLAPRLMHYVEKARVASDQEVANTILTAAKFGYMQYEEAWNDARDNVGTSETDPDTLDLGDEGPVDSTPAALFTITGSKWVKEADYEPTNKFINELKEVVDDFTLKSGDAGVKTQITIAVWQGKVSVALDYDTTDSVVDYEVSE